MVMSVFILKLIAMCSMLIDHIAFSLVNNNLAMRNIGRFAFFIYAFLIAESYFHLREKPEKLKIHLIKLLVRCVVSEPLFDRFDHYKWIDPSSQSVLPTLMLGFVALICAGWWRGKFQNKKSVAGIGTIGICFTAALFSYYLNSDYAFGGVVLVVLFYVYLTQVEHLKFPQRLVLLLVIEAVFMLFDIWRRIGFGGWQEFKEMAVVLGRWKYGLAVSMLPFAFYNRRLGYHSKWFSWLYSIFYPLQFVVLIIARYFIRGF